MLGYILVGNKPESKLYVKLKTQVCDELGIQHHGIEHADGENVTEQEIIDYI